MIDPHLLDALEKAYAARAKLFHNGVKASQIDLLIAEIDATDADGLSWGPEIGVSSTALAKVVASGTPPHQVFAHPAIIESRPHLVAYYRNLVAISKKGIGQILFPTDSYEARRRLAMEPTRAAELCLTLNRIVSAVIDEVEGYSIQLSRQTILAEIGTELQGTWANIVGKGATKAVEDLLERHISALGIGEKLGRGSFRLANGWTIRFSSEPDVAFVDASGAIRIVIEIKGSLDKAGAQTRYGEAKKSFAKALAENPRCYTVYLASCFTQAVVQQIAADGQVRDWFNLTSILYDESERDTFLGRIFHVVNTPE